MRKRRLKHIFLLLCIIWFSAMLITMQNLILEGATLTIILVCIAQVTHFIITILLMIDAERLDR